MPDGMIAQVIVQLIGFAVAFAILKRFAWKPILTLLDERRQRIEKSFREIEEAKKEAADFKRTYEAKIAKIEDEARLRIQDAISEGKRIAQEIREKAREEAQGLLVKAKENIDLEMAKARIELRENIVGLALNAAEHLIRREMNEEKQHRMVREFLEELAEEPKP